MSREKRLKYMVNATEFNLTCRKYRGKFVWAHTLSTCLEEEALIMSFLAE